MLNMQLAMMTFSCHDSASGCKTVNACSDAQLLYNYNFYLKSDLNMLKSLVIYVLMPCLKM